MNMDKYREWLHMILFQSKNLNYHVIKELKNKMLDMDILTFLDLKYTDALLIVRIIISKNNMTFVHV